MKKLAYLGFFIGLILWGNLSRAELIDRIMARVNDQIITRYDLHKLARPYLKPYQSMGSTPEYREKEEAVLKKVLDELIEQRLLEGAAAKVGISVSKKDIESYLKGVMAQNNMDQGQFTQALKMQGMSLEQYGRVIAGQILKIKVVNRMFRRQVKVSDEDIKNYYSQTANVINKDRQIRVRHILLKLEGDYPPEQEKSVLQKLKMIKEKISQGADFSEMARQYSQCPSAKNGGDLGFFGRGEMVEPFEKKAFSMKQGDISEPVKTAFGFHLIQLVEFKNVGTKSLQEVKEKIRGRLLQEKLEEKYSQWILDVKKKSHVEIFP